MARKIAVSDSAVARAALEEMAEVAANAGMEGLVEYSEFLLECASDVKFQPSTRQLVLKFDLDMSGGASEPLPGQPGYDRANDPTHQE